MLALDPPGAGVAAGRKSVLGSGERERIPVKSPVVDLRFDFDAVRRLNEVGVAGADGNELGLVEADAAAGREVVGSRAGGVNGSKLVRTLLAGDEAITGSVVE